MTGMEEPKDIIVLGAIKNGTRKFDKIAKAAKIDPKELNEILEKLEERGFISVEEKKSFFGKKVEILITEKGSSEVDQRVHELQEKWGTMSAIYKSGDKKKLKQHLDDNKSILPMMMFFGVMDIMMFSMMFSMLGMSMGDYVPAESMPEDMDAGTDSADAGAGDMDGGGFDFDIGF